MKITTKALLALLIVTALSIQTIPARAQSGFSSRMQRQVERVQQHHDRKLELRAAVLGISTDELRQELKTKTFDQIIKDHGFKDRSAFLVALQGKIKDELKRRGLSDEQIAKVLKKREHRAENLQ